MDSLKFRVVYEAKYEYEDVVTSNDNTLKIVPYDGDNQEVIKEIVDTEPKGYKTSYKDMFGNTVYRLKVIEPHYSLLIRSNSSVNVKVKEFEDYILPCHVKDGVFLNSSRLIDVEYFRPIAKELLKSSKTLDDLVKNTVEIVRGRLKYKEGSTNVDTTARESFELGMGVCQDFAQITIGILRASGIPSRYVMGLVNDNPVSTHAWVEFKSPSGWIPVDPTRKRFYSLAYVKFAIGRDYYDTSPVLGTFVSRGRGWLKKLTVMVRKID
ncbi:transglutaminase family protein [Acidianus sp. HS-5]|uniref:transglutaminase family protein n=1 Tax=Acidianus sp. HS-5 TaxID=2886040 RepID=UPI001F44F4BD|nr:transglutaminase family protein [Acidianus sp. HS-5]BDC18696.1 transglutaminase [Acidianus sp. HS-5]